MKIKIIKKNRKYFSAQTEFGRKCKVVIDENSEGLEPGEQSLLMEDVSVRSRYGTDLIYRLITVDKDENTTTLKSPYNTLLISKCRDLGGVWDKENQIWVFPGFVEEEVKNLDGIFNSSKVVVELTAINEIYGIKQGIEFLGVSLCKAYGRDSGAKMENGISVISGCVDSVGSRKNWKTVIYQETVIRLSIPSKLVETYKDSRFSIKLVG
ncbi:hypothetical protein BCU70_17755 [Vibrio sp. 10N.286.49.C2]|uniref:hypothetical protein n=1 Tax=Vibrio TaxID=662 RepID=UPI00080EC9F0|nr:MULTISPECIES: hypothetical protein [Vibrio]OCH60339.1 hypothetical protein A6D94_19290 [Vibrio splendidus]PMH36276.1 hypothetical protein BCU70_17755 [Vibrio sp. 10N.286.49.C2]PMH53392.1 hypothetical protein BCU66_00775 [Vibrio sp. 10N.286.49.B1]